MDSRSRNRIKQLIDPTTDPCTDFFQYACGNFSKLYPIPNDRSAYGTGAMIVDYTEHILRSMLDRAAAGGPGRTRMNRRLATPLPLAWIWTRSTRGG